MSSTELRTALHFYSSTSNASPRHASEDTRVIYTPLIMCATHNRYCSRLALARKFLLFSKKERYFRPGYPRALHRRAAVGDSPRLAHSPLVPFPHRQQVALTMSTSLVRADRMFSGIVFVICKMPERASEDQNHRTASLTGKSMMSGLAGTQPKLAAGTGKHDSAACQKVLLVRMTSLTVHLHWKCDQHNADVGWETMTLYVVAIHCHTLPFIRAGFKSTCLATYTLLSQQCSYRNKVGFVTVSVLSFLVSL